MLVDLEIQADKNDELQQALYEEFIEEVNWAFCYALTENKS